MINRSYVPYKAFYFFVYAAMAAATPFFTLYYESLGLTGRQVGALAALPPLFTFLAAPLFGFLADLTGQPKRLLLISILSVVLGMVALTAAETYVGLILAVGFYALFFAPILPIIDRSVLDALGERRDQYGRQRLWGAVGWGIAAPLAGSLAYARGLEWAFYTSSALFGCLLIWALRMPISAPAAREPFWLSFKKLMGSWPVVIFFGVALGGGIGLALIHHYLFLYLDSLGANSRIMGWALTVATVSELFVMGLSSQLLQRWKARGLLLFSLIFLSLRFFAYAVITDPVWALALQLLHGPTFAALWIASVAYVAEIAPAGLRNTSQGMLTGFVMGLASTLGAVVGGVLYESVGFAQMFLWAGVGILIVLLLFVAGCRGRC